MKNKKIIFEQTKKYIDGLFEKPKPSTNFLPKWYKEEKLFTNKENVFLKALKKIEYGTTYKLCVPVVDSLTAGYMLELPADIVVTNKNIDGGYEPFISWGVDFPILDNRDIRSLGNYPMPKGFCDLFLRWIIDWKIVTPKGYSLWVTHPSHRHDLPFFTLTGFVDTDKHPNSLYLPFFIEKNFEGVIPAGTPIAQIIPIKRDYWKSFEKKYIEKNNYNSLNSVKIHIIRTYKKMYWTKKKYE